ncbi:MULTISPECIES: CFI-box-CTERM domain-containing protein [unclassified Microcoleus]|uniref:CFI-box-CTERM domain-containing protein n=1 Tax=unclassified Microcoleus TaxID=2642155 RepID=UPI002FD26F33
MTDFSYLDRLVNEAGEEVGRLLERAAYYRKQKDAAQALTNYVDALNAYAKFAEHRTNLIKVMSPIDIIGQRESAITYSQTLCHVADILAGIRLCYSDSVIQAFLENKLQVISEALAEYEFSFDAEKLKTYADLRKFVNNHKEHIESNREAIEKLKKTSVKELDDQTLAKIRSALDKISSTEVCPVTLDSTGACFIATAAYSTSTHPDLDTFRNFRDERLLTNPVGKQLVSLYYQISPSLAKYMETQPAIKSFSRQQLQHLAEWMRSQKVKNQ